MSSRVSWIGLSLLVVASAVSSGQTKQQVQTVTIHSGWGGLGTPQDSTITIRRTRNGFERNKKPIDPQPVLALVSALQASQIAKPDAGNLGITEQWLTTQVASQKPSAFSQATNTTPKQLAFFGEKFTDLKFVTDVMPNLWKFVRFDDYPNVRVEVEFEDGAKVSASTHSYYVFMIPWKLEGTNNETYNADISRAVAALLPDKAVNRDRLAGSDLAAQLTNSVMQTIESEWKLMGVEERAGDSLAELRSQYTISASDINPYHSAEYGVQWNPKGPHETNLHVTLHKPEFPPNLSVEGIFLSNNGTIEGINEFLKTGSEYEDLTLSVTWLMDWLRNHPDRRAFLFNVHGLSFGEHAMKTFTEDMKLRGREDLVEKVRAQQAKVALLKIDGADWLIFPDRHLLLWRYEWSRGLLDWTPIDFGQGDCADYRVNNGGCSGREVSANGTLLSAHEPHDRECMAQTANGRAVPELSGDNLFPVMDRGKGGYIDRDGKIIIPLCFEEVGAFSEGLARFERDGRWGYIDTKGDVVIEPKFPWAEEFREGLARVQVSGSQLGYDGRWGFIDKTGAVVVPADYADTLGETSNIGSDDDESAFHEGLALVVKNYKYGFVDKNGEPIVPPQFEYAGPFSEGLAPAAIKAGEITFWGYIDRTGKWVIPPKLEAAYPFSNHLAGVEQDKSCGYISSSGELVVQLPGKTTAAFCSGTVSEFSEGLAVWRQGKLSGYIDTSGRAVIPAKFEVALPFSEGLAGVRVDGKWGFIDATGRMVIQPMDLLGAEEFHNGLSFVRTKEMRYGYIDRAGRFVWKPTLLYAN